MMTDVAQVAAAAKTIGQALDADVAAVKAKLEAAEARISKLETGTVAWFKANWLHVVNSAGVGYLVALARHLI